MSTYSTGAEAYRDTVKWLVAFLPVGTLVAAAVALGPRLLEEAATARNFTEWRHENGWVMLGIGLLIVGAALVMWFGASLLSTQPEHFQDLLTQPDNARLIRAINDGVAQPYFVDDVKFREERNDLLKKWDDEEAVDEAALQRVTSATELLRAWALQQSLGAAFTRFAWAFGGGVVLILGGFLLTAGALGPTAVRFTKPTTVELHVNRSGAAALRAATGCIDPRRSTYLAVEGSWEAPVLEVDGPRCRFGARWEPRRGFELRPAPSGSVQP